MLQLRAVQRFSIAVLCLLGSSASAQDAATEPSPEGVSEEEMRLLMEAFGEQDNSDDDTPASSNDFSITAMQSGLTPVGGTARNTGNSNPDISLILDVAGAWFSADENLQAGAHDPNRNGFNLQQLEMSIGSNIDPFFRFDANLVFAQFGVEVEEAYATTLSLPWNLQLRAGQFLTRFGRLNNTHPHSWSFVDQPIVNGKFFGGEGSRGLGAEASVLLPTPWFAEVIVSLTDAAGECCARSFYGGEDLGVKGVEELLLNTRLEQFFPFGPDWSLMWGISSQTGPNPTGNGNRTLIGGSDLYLRWRPTTSAWRQALSLTVEGMYRSRQVPDDRLEDYGGYTQLVWNLTPRWETGVRYEYVTGVASDPLDPEWTRDRDRTSGQLTFYPSHFSRVRLQGSLDNPRWRARPIRAAFIALEVVSGAHGAHSF